MVNPRIGFSTTTALISRIIPLVERAWSLQPTLVSPALCALIAAGYSSGVGIPTDITVALIWTARVFRPCPDLPVMPVDDARMGDALLLLWNASGFLFRKESPHAKSFELGVYDLYDRIQKSWAGSRTDTIRHAVWGLAKETLRRARVAGGSWPDAHAALERAAKEGSGCAAASLYTACRDGADGMAQSSAEAARWAERCTELGHSIPADGEMRGRMLGRNMFC